MRFAVIETIYKAALKNKKIYFLTGDLGHAKEEEFKKNIPNQYLNTGLSEQNMIGVAAGLALAGNKVFAYSITPFVTMRGYEQVKDDICYQNLDVTLIGIGGGFAYGKYGNTHCSIEDIAIMRVLPNMKIVCPDNPVDAEHLTTEIINLKGPTYIRIGRGKEPIPEQKYKVKFGRASQIKKGKDLTIIATGTLLQEAQKAAMLLKKNNISAEILHMHTIKPIDKKTLLENIKSKKAIFTMEEHSIFGGLGGAVAEILAENFGTGIIFKRFGVNDVYLHEIGDQDYLRSRHGISGEKVANQILKIYAKS